jgi:uncharacterized protein YqhQ
VQRIVTVAMFFAFVAVYLLSTGIPFAHTDGLVMYETARAIGLEGKLDLAPSSLPQVVIGQDGRSYSKYDPGLPLLVAPVVRYADGVAVRERAHRYAVAAVFVMIVPAVGMALAMAGLFWLGQRIYSNRRAILIVAVAGLGTTAWVYGRLFFAEAVLTGMLTLAVALVAAKSANTVSRVAETMHGVPARWAIEGASLAMGLAILTRASMVIYLPGLAYLLWRRAPKGRRWQWLVVAGSGPALAIAALLYHNYYRFGTLFRTGYEGEGFTTFPLTGIVGLLVSPGKSVFLFAPPMLLSAILWPRFRRRQAVLARTILFMTITALVYYGAWWAWHGGWVWGPRFLVPLMPLWCLAWGELPGRVTWGVAAAMLLGLGVGVQVLGTFTNTNRAYAEAFAGASDPDDTRRYAMVHYDLDYSPLAVSLRQGLEGRWEKLAVYHLDGTDLTGKWIDGVPRTIHRMLAVSLVVIGWALLDEKQKRGMVGMAKQPKLNYGGQAVMEGVMMRGVHIAAVAVRDPKGNIVIHEEALNPALYRGRISKIPFLRGLVGLWDALVLGTRALMWSANVALAEEENAPAAGMLGKPQVAYAGNVVVANQATMVFSQGATVGIVILSLTLGIGLFFALPAALSNGAQELFNIRSRLAVDTIEGVAKLSIFVGYIALTGLVKDIRRVYGYHGAEHKTINAYEAGSELTPEEVQKHSIEHPRCGTAFLLTVILLSILVHAITGRPKNIFALIFYRVLVIPVIAGLAYEIIRFTARHSKNPVVKALIIPNLALQRLTTRRPDNAMVEVAIAAFERVLAAEEAVARGETVKPESEVVIVPTPAVAAD